MTDPAICQFISSASPLGDRDHQPTTPQTREMVGQNLTRDPDLVSQFRRIVRRAVEAQQDSSARRVTQRMPESGQSVRVLQRCHAPIVQPVLYSRKYVLM